VSPAPGEGTHAALAPYAVLVPYSNLHALTSDPSGSTVALGVRRHDRTAVVFGEAFREELKRTRHLTF